MGKWAKNVRGFSLNFCKKKHILDNFGSLKNGAQIDQNSCFPYFEPPTVIIYHLLFIFYELKNSSDLVTDLA